jgi:hypothetical protein
MLGYYVLPVLYAIGALAVAVFVFALYRLFRALAPAVSLIGAVLAIGGSVILAVTWVIAGDQNAAPQNIIGSAVVPAKTLHEIFAWAERCSPSASR